MGIVHDQGPIVGRTAELELLSQRLADAHRGQARTVLIGGEAGVGKSRLLSRFVQTARESGAHVLTGACEEHFGDPMPYSPLLEVLETFRHDHGARRAAELGGPTYHQLASFFELGSGPMSNPQQVFLAVRRMLDHIGSTPAPVVLVLEDLHWADRSTLDLVRHLAQADPDDRHLLLVCSYRSRELRRGDPLWQLLAEPTFLRRTERLDLPPFGQADLAEFLAGVAGGQVDPTLVERCLRWSDGIPFFAEQLMAAGALDDPDGIELPDNIRDVILARLSTLGSDALRVLQVAAVAGRAVSRQLLRTVSGLTGTALHDALQECFDLQLLVAGSTKDVYRFRHALLREAVYRSMVRDLQADLHIAMAEALAADPQLSLAEGSAAAEQASHWYQAGDRAQALASAVQAGGTAARTLAFPAAEVQYTRALALWQQVADPEERAGMSRGQLLAATAEAARWSGHVDQAVENIRAAIAQADRDSEVDPLGELHERLATYLWEAGKRAESWKAFQQARTLLEDAPASAVKARVLAGIALGHLQAGRYTDGRKVADTALEMARAVDAQAEEGRALNILGLALGMQGEPEAAEERLSRALEIARAVNRIEDLLRAYGNLGLVLEDAGRLRKAAEVTMTGLREARQLDLADTRQGIVLANNASVVLMLLGEWAAAERIIVESSLDRPPAESLYPRLTLAGIKVARGDYPLARDLLASIENVEHGADPRFLGPLHTIRAELALGEGDLDQAADEVACGVAAVRNRENALELLRLCAVGMRCAADQASRPGGDQPAHADPMAVGDHLARLVADARPEPPTPEAQQLVVLCKAERQRIRGKDTDALWNVVASGWDRLDRPYPAAYARSRQAVAACARGDLESARRTARDAYQAARKLGAEPLAEEVARFAKGMGLDLADRQIEAQTPYGLTEAELEILRYLAEEHGASWIAAERHVSKRTVQTQQRNIYRKLEVHSASEAVRKAREAGLLR
jgi:DNA-binding CsgD family transcriptional regulator